MKTKQFITLLALPAFLLACSKESAAPSGPETPDVTVQKGNFTLVASTDIVAKTELGTDSYIYWKASDAISVWEAGNNSNANVKLDLLSESDGSKRGTFTGTLTPSTDAFKLYAVYPYSSSYGSDPSAIALNLPAAVGQITDVNGLVGVSDFMVGSASFTTEDSDYAMKFRYPLSLLDIVVDGSNSCLSGATAQSLTITANTAFVGDATLDLTTGTLTPAESGKSLTVTFPSTAAVSSAQHAWVAIYPVDLRDADCCFDLKFTNGQEIKFNVNPKKAFEEQKIYTINLTNIDAHVDAGEASPIFFDLVGANSSKGYSLNRANCYIVSEGGYYKFAAQHIDKTNIFSGTVPYTDGYRADWLWATSADAKADFISIGNSGAINFRAPANANGSTVIALKNPSGDIIWSWHIWCAPEDILEPTHYSRGDSWQVSDANLGAKSKTGTDAYGFYYQWGRKDPFPGNKDNCVFNTGVSINGVSSKTTADVVADAIGYTVAHPTTILYQNDYRTWISTPDQANNAQNLWNNTTNKSKKTNYDPCPAGYCVPVVSGYAWGASFVASAMTWQSDGVIYTDPTGVAAFYPAAGYLNGLNLTDAGATVRNWAANLSATPSATSNMLGYSLLMTLSTQSFKVNEGSRAGFALPVRCMKI